MRSIPQTTGYLAYIQNAVISILCDNHGQAAEIITLETHHQQTFYIPRRKDSFVLTVAISALLRTQIKTISNAVTRIPRSKHLANFYVFSRPNLHVLKTRDFPCSVHDVLLIKVKVAWHLIKCLRFSPLSTTIYKYQFKKFKHVDSIIFLIFVSYTFICNNILFI